MPTTENPLGNIFDLNGIPSTGEEVFEDLLKGAGFKVERIISKGQTTPEGIWYDQDWNEWVMVVQGAADLLMEGSEPFTMKAGDYVMLPAHLRHRVVHTTSDPECIWLAIHWDR